MSRNGDKGGIWKVTGESSGWRGEREMGRQSVKQAARSTVREALKPKHKERLEAEKRHTGWAVELLAAVAERNQVIAEADKAAAGAVCNLIGDGLSVADIAGLCGDQVDAKEIGRLAKLNASRVESQAR